MHADMVAWHYAEPVELAALQLWNVMFSVPQLSVRMAEIPPDHVRMIEAFTRFWLAHRDVLLFSDFEVHQPLANYPLLEAHTASHCIAGLYQDMVYRLRADTVVHDVINAKATRGTTNGIVVDARSASGHIRGYGVRLYGGYRITAHTRVGGWRHAFDVPTAGRLNLRGSNDRPADVPPRLGFLQLTKQLYGNHD